MIDLLIIIVYNVSCQLEKNMESVHPEKRLQTKYDKLRSLSFWVCKVARARLYDIFSFLFSFKVIPGIEEGEEGDDDVMEKEGAEGEKKEPEKGQTKEYEDDDAGWVRKQFFFFKDDKNRWKVHPSFLSNCILK